MNTMSHNWSNASCHQNVSYKCENEAEKVIPADLDKDSNFKIEVKCVDGKVRGVQDLAVLNVRCGGEQGIPGRAAGNGLERRDPRLVDGLGVGMGSGCWVGGARRRRKPRKLRGARKRRNE